MKCCGGRARIFAGVAKARLGNRGWPRAALAVAVAALSVLPAVALPFAVAVGAATVTASLSACGSGTPAIKPSTLSPSPSAATASGSPTATSVPTPSVAPSTLSPSGAASASGVATPGAGVATPTDQQIRAGIMRRLAAAPDLAGLTFRVVVYKGVVTLVGTVNTASQRHTAEHIAVTERGVVKVISYVQVSPASGY